MAGPGNRAERYRNAPAAKTLHHAYIGGSARSRGFAFRFLRPGIAAIIRRSTATCSRREHSLHDIGKIHELTYNRSFSYSTRGQLLGHMIIELEMLQAKLALVPGFPPDLENAA